MDTSPDSPAGIWASLDEPWQEAFRQAWQAFRTGNIAVGACASTLDGEIIYAARNRVCDSTGPEGEIFGSGLAHAEMNVLARLPFRRYQDLVITTTLQPCLQCAAAIRMAPVVAVRFAGRDPYWDGLHEFGRLSAREAGRGQPARTGPRHDELGVFAVLMSRFGPTLTSRTFELALRELGEGPLNDMARELEASGEAGRLAVMPVEQAFAALWPRLAALAADRAAQECQTPRLELETEPRRSVVRPVTDLQRRVAPFDVVTEMTPAGDQPQAIAEISDRVRAGEKDTVLLGATGTGKTASVAWIAEQLQRPMLVMLPNKTLAAQFANELREMLPQNAIEYFVSYYDYYQPEAYIPQTDTYIEKDSSLNQEVERLRHSATNSLLTRRDTIVVASVSCIYGLGTPQEYVDRMLTLRVGDSIEREQLLRRLVGMQYNRNDVAFTRGTFRVRGDTIEIIPMYEELAVRIELFGDEIERLMTLHPLTGEVMSEDTELYIFPASHYVAGPERMERAIAGIEAELADRLAEMDKAGQLLEAQRLRMRTTYDIEMMRQVGSCSGIENYSRHIDGRGPGTPPNTLLDYFPEDFLLVIDESHVTVPQIGAMYEGDVSRKRVLVQHGFRLPSAIDNRPLTWDEFLERIGQTIYLSATPGPYELQRVHGDVVEQVIRPTGLIDPEVVIKPTKGQIDDLLHEIRQRSERDERVLVTTLTKRMAEDLTDYLLENGVRARYLHSEVDTLRRVELLRELRTGEYDVLVGINLLREGLDLPEVSLVAILDADKEGFLRSATSLIQTIGRAARNVSGQVHMYADQVTPSMERAIEETNRRRDKQVAYNKANGVDPQPLRKRIADILDQIVREDADTEQLIGGAGRQQSRGKAPVPGLSSRARAAAKAAAARTGAELAESAKGGGEARAELIGLITELTEQMHGAAAELQFEVAARIRDEIKELKHELRGMQAAGV